MTAQAKRIGDAEPPKSPRKPRKLEQCLDMLLAAHAAGRYVYAFDALNAYRDTCLHSTVDELRDRGIRFVQRPHGNGTRFQDYRLHPESVERARRLRDTYRLGRGALVADPEETPRHD